MSKYLRTTIFFKLITIITIHNSYYINLPY